jgi:hypothetical protein
MTDGIFPPLIPVTGDAVELRTAKLCGGVRAFKPFIGLFGYDAVGVAPVVGSIGEGEEYEGTEGTGLERRDWGSVDVVKGV